MVRDASCSHCQPAHRGLENKWGKTARDAGKARAERGRLEIRLQGRETGSFRGKQHTDTGGSMGKQSPVHDSNNGALRDDLV